MIKKGFTLVELLFVMAIIAILAGFAIANLKDSTKVAQINSMKNDLRNAISTEQTYFASNQAYDTVSKDFSDTTNGMILGDNGAKFTLSKGNSIQALTGICDDGSPQIYLYVFPEQTGGVGVSFKYDSCNDGGIQEETYC